MSGERGFSYTEQHRHECEVRHVAALPTRQERAEYLEGITRKRGAEAGERMRADVAAHWALRRGQAAPVGEAGERLGEDDLATQREELFREAALNAQRAAAAQPAHPPGSCAYCRAACLPQAVYCDAQCRADHEREQQVLRRQGRTR